MLVKNNKETIMKFKSVAAALLAAVTCVSMAACGSGGDTNADGKVEITMWHNSTTGDGKAYWESAAKAFEKETRTLPSRSKPFRTRIWTASCRPLCRTRIPPPISLWRVVARSYVMWSKLGKPWT